MHLLSCRIKFLPLQHTHRFILQPVPTSRKLTSILAHALSNAHALQDRGLTTGLPELALCQLLYVL
jgi:hypothetical protein